MTDMPTDAIPGRDSEKALRLIATNDLLSSVIPLRSTYGTGGSIGTVAALVKSQQQEGPTLWVDSGDFFGGVATNHCGELPVQMYESADIAVACVGNHDLDYGVAALNTAAGRLPFEVLCADRPLGVAGDVLVDTAAGPIGFVGISHPDTEELSSAPPRMSDWVTTTRRTADDLRGAGAKWVVALGHLGVTWFANPSGVDHEPAAFEAAWEPVADAFDLVLGGHTFTGWVGSVAGVPAGQAHGFAGSVLIVDIPVVGMPTIHPLVRPPEVSVNSVVPGASDDGVLQLVRELDRMDAEVIGELAEGHTMPATNDRSLATFVADAFLREVTDADAAFVAACELWTQAPLDGVIASFGPGVVSALDVRRVFPYDEPLCLAEVGPGEFERFVTAHDAATARSNRRSDGIWWNWARFPAGTGHRHHDPRQICLSSFAVRLMEDLLERRVKTRTLDVRGSDCLRRAVR